MCLGKLSAQLDGFLFKTRAIKDTFAIRLLIILILITVGGIKLEPISRRSLKPTPASVDHPPPPVAWAKSDAKSVLTAMKWSCCKRLGSDHIHLHK